MLSFFRNFSKSRAGLIVVFLILGIIAVAFALGDISNVRSFGGGTSGKALATVNGKPITDTDLRVFIDREIQRLRENNQPVTMEQFVQAGGVEWALEQLISADSYEQFGALAGMHVTGKQIDSDIVNSGNFNGIDGKFNQASYEAALQRIRMSPAEMRTRVAQGIYNGWLLSRPGAPTFVPNGVAAAYASRRLERRTGEATLIRLADMDVGPAPDDKALQAFYTQHRANYMIPERRVIRYSVIRPDSFKAQAAATDAEVADAFKKAGARFAATEKRTLTQVILIDQATANAVAAEVKGGKPIADIARARGLEPRTFDAVEKPALQRESNAAVADAAFAAAQDGVVGPVRGPLGWVVMRVEKIEKIAAKTLDQARPDLVKEIEARKTIELLVAQRQLIDDGIGEQETLDQIAAKAKLQLQSSPALTAAAVNPDDAAFKPDETLAAIVRGAFAVEGDSQEVQMVPLGEDGSYAVLAVGKVVAATPRPFASIRDDVRRDYQHDVAVKKAREAGQKLITELKKGTPMREAIAKAGIRALPPESFDIVHQQLDEKTPAQFRLVFSTPLKSARMVESPDKNGFYIVHVGSVEHRDASGNAPLMAAARARLGQEVYGEQAIQFVKAMQRDLKVTRDDAAIAAFRRGLISPGNTGQ